MAVVLDSTTGGAEGLFNRLGRLIKAIQTILGEMEPTTSNSIADKINDVYGYFEQSPIEIREVVAGLVEIIRDVQSNLAGPVEALRDVAESTIVTMYDEDLTLPDRTLEEALEALVRQMLDGDYHVDANTVGASVTQTSLTGTGVVVTTTKLGNGLINQHLIAETARIRVDDNANPGSETLSIRGQAATGLLAYDWPKGSGGSRQYTSLDAESGANLVANGAFETFTVTNTPDDWTITVGTVGTTILQEASTVYKGSKALRIQGNGSQLTQIRQELTGLEALRNYAINFWCRNSANPSTGVLQVDLFDGSSVINDEAGTANSFTVDLTTLGTSFVAKNGIFRLPDPLPTTVYLRLHLTTAEENAKSTYIDQLAMQLMEPVTTDGRTPDVAFFSGAVGWAIDDGGDQADNVFQIAVTNNRASDWQTWFERLFDTPSRGIQLRYAGSNLINDSLIA
jgi:hypothetical protein